MLRNNAYHYHYIFSPRFESYGQYIINLTQFELAV